MEETRQPAAVGFIVNIMYRASRRPSQMSEANAEVGRRVFCIDRRRKTSCFQNLEEIILHSSHLQHDRYFYSGH